ncbi:MAG: lamin tail domain-containing protein [bacterium]|nr:lamin tail domain-containing protein [bacterium]
MIVSLIRRAGVLGLALSFPFATVPARAAVPDEVHSLEWCPFTKNCLQWSSTPGALDYLLYRGGAGDLLALLGAAAAGCTAGTFAEPTADAGLDDPAPGSLHWFLVTARNADGEGPAGDASSGPRSVNGNGSCSSGGGLVLNEVDYDQPGIDSEEFVEIYNAGPSARDLSDVALILVNGNTQLEYRRIELLQAAPVLDPGAYLVVGSPAVVATLPAGVPSIEFAANTNSVQNGAPDAIALFDTTTGTLLDALSYEGSISAAQFDGVAGTFDLVEGTPTAAADSNSVPGSLARFPDGQDTGDASADWHFNNVSSPGGSNPIP